MYKNIEQSKRKVRIYMLHECNLGYFHISNITIIFSINIKIRVFISYIWSWKIPVKPSVQFGLRVPPGGHDRSVPQ